MNDRLDAPECKSNIPALLFKICSLQTETIYHHALHARRHVYRLSWLLILKRLNYERSLKCPFNHNMPDALAQCTQIERVYFEGSLSCFPVLYPRTDAAASRDGERSAVAVGTSDFTQRAYTEKQPQ